MLPLFVPWLLIILLLLVTYYLVRKRWIIAIIVLFACVAINWHYKCFALHICCDDSISKCSISIMCYNIEGMNGEIKEKAPKIFNQISRYNPDIVFITEYSEQDVLALDTLLKKQYPYSSEDLHNEGSYFYGKHPLSQAQRLKDITSGEYIGVFLCDAYVNNDTIRLLGCHLFSNNYDSSHIRVTPDSIRNNYEVLSYIKNIKWASEKRQKEAQTAARMIPEGCQALSMGDLNDVCGSKTLRVLESAGLKDAWWEGGLGYGATIHHPLPYRIDHIMHSKDLKLKQINIVDSEGVSDHDALYAVFEY